MNDNDAVIYDCDGTLVNVGSVIHHLTGEHRNFHRFHRESVNCPPNQEVVDALVEDYYNGLNILIVTARVKKYWPETQFWLRHNIPVPYHGIWMRADGDFRPDGVIKREILAMIREEYNVVKAWDDNPVVIDVWESEGIPEINVVKGHWYD